MSQQPPPPPPLAVSTLKKHKELVRVSLATIILVIVLFSPIVYRQRTVTKTRTRSLQFGSEV